MEKKDYVAFEYMTKSVKSNEQTRVIDLYEAFGWEVTDTTPTMVEGVNISFKRERKLKHKTELSRLERKAEELYGSINSLNKQKTSKASIFGYTFGVIAALILGGGMSMVMTLSGVGFLAGGIALGVLGIALCAVNYPIYKRIADKSTKKVLPVIDETEESLANVLEQGNSLLTKDEI